MAVCPQCGCVPDVPARFCVECGAKMPDLAAPAPASVAAAPATTRGSQPPARHGADWRIRRVEPSADDGASEDEVDAVLGDAPGAEAPPAAAPASEPEPAPEPAPDDGKTEFERLLEEVEDGFAAILDNDPGELDRQPTDHDRAYDDQAVRFLFDEIASNYVRPVRQMMLELKVGKPPREWLDVSVPAMTALQRSAQGMGMSDLVDATDTFLAALKLAHEAEGSTIGEPERGLLFEAYGALEEVMPEAFNLEREAGRREPLIVQGVLLRVDGVGKVTVDKIVDAGLMSLEMFLNAKPQDLADATGITVDLCERILLQFRNFARETEEMVPASSHVLPDARLALLLETLVEHHRAYEEARSRWTHDARERAKRARADRADTWLQITLLLARVGEVDLLATLEALPFDRKIERIQRYIDELTLHSPPQSETL
jgi:hypothetical protein